MPFARATDVVLELPEVRQHAGVAPAWTAACGPAIVVFGLTADVDETVDRARPAESSSARPIDLSSVHSGVRLSVEAPVVDRMEHRLRVPDRNVNPGGTIGGARFEQ